MKTRKCCSTRANLGTKPVVVIKVKIALSLLIRSEDNCRAHALRDLLAKTRAVVLRREGKGIDTEFETEKQLCARWRGGDVPVQT